MSALKGVAILCFLYFVTVGATDLDSPAVLMRDFCLNEHRIDTCALRFGSNLTILDVVDMMATNNIKGIREICKRNKLRRCVGACLMQFKSSIHGHMLSMCAFIRWMQWEKSCWTEDFAREARECYNEMYPEHRRSQFYPEPYRVYDRHTIESRCFPSAKSAGDKCPYYQSFIFLHLMPNYFELYGYPEGFDHLPNSLGFPGI